MDTRSIQQQLDTTAGVVRLNPQIVARFYGDGNRLGQRDADAPKPDYYHPERWIGSSTAATNPSHIPSGGVSTCAELDGEVTLKDLLAHPEFGPRLLGPRRYKLHDGQLRVLIKLLDPVCPIPFHVHAPDKFVYKHPKIYPAEQFGKDEAYHFLDAPKGACPYTHLGLYDGVTATDVVEAMKRGSDHVLELSPGAYQRFGEGFYVPAGLLHRPGTALTLEIQQPSDVYTMFQTDFGGQPLPPDALHPGFSSIEEAAEAVVTWEKNRAANLLEKNRLQPQPGALPSFTDGAEAHWIFPPEASTKFSGLRLTIETNATLRLEQACVLFAWKGTGKLNGRPIDGGAGHIGAADEFFLGIEAVKKGVEIENAGQSPLVLFVLFPESLV